MSVPKKYTTSFGKTYIIAPFWRRLAAFVLDSLLIIFIGLFMAKLLESHFDFLFDTGELAPESYYIAVNVISRDSFSRFFIIGLPYHLIAEQSSWQGSIGKRVLGMTAVDKDAEKPSFWQSLLRNFFKFSILVFIPVLIRCFVHVFPPLVFIIWVIILIMAANDGYNRFLSDFPTKSFVLLRNNKLL